MGYYTSYKLKWKAHGTVKDKPNCDHPQTKGAKFCPECGNAVGVQGLDSRIGEYIKANNEAMHGIDPSGYGSEDCKWYEHEEHMISMSEHFPNVLFTLSGEGEESGDIWNKYFLNGKMQVAKARIESDPFDESKLSIKRK